MPHEVAILSGAGWGEWRGCWTSSRVLECREGRWQEWDRGLPCAEWETFEAAVAELWSQRCVRDRKPWAVGWSGYEACAAAAGGLPARPHASGLPMARWLLEPEPCPQTTVGLAAGAPAIAARLSLSLDDAEFRCGVEVVRDHIAAGAAYQVNLTRRFSIHPWEGGLEQLARVARRESEPQYFACCSWPEGELVCASMELLLRRRGTELLTRPIKGTRARGDTAEHDRALRCELAEDAKERAELAMVVDLERNDLGRIAEIGSVRVLEEGRLESYPTLHHRVATVSARPASGLAWWQMVAAMAPGGSVTGCPKRAAMELIAELERCPRGPYTGALGVVAGNGDLELALPIRTAWREGDAVHFAAGCGVVWQSDAAHEERESRLKVLRWLELVS